MNGCQNFRKWKTFVLSIMCHIPGAVSEWNGWMQREVVLGNDGDDIEYYNHNGW